MVLKLKTAADRSTPAPSMVKLLLSVPPAPPTSVNVNVLPASGSVPPNVPTAVPIDWPSAIDVDVSEMSVGVSFALVTVTAIDCVSVLVPSDACTITS